MNITKDDVSCITNYDGIYHDFHIKLDTLYEMVKKVPKDISSWMGENIILTYQDDNNYWRLKKIKRLFNTP
jgi:hypothetical protein